MSREPTDPSGMPITPTVSRDKPVPVIVIALAMALIVVASLALFSSLRERRPLRPPLANLPSAHLPSTSPPPALQPIPSQGDTSAPAPVEAPAPMPATEEPLTLMSATPPPPPAPAAPALTGEAALIEALRVGQLGLATGGDLSRWTLRWSEANRRGVPPSFLDAMRVMDMYVIRKDFTIPDGLTGAHAVIFILDRDVPYPRGNPGHSAILDITTGACRGPSCHSLSER